MIESLTKLAASKDIAAFHALQAPAHQEMDLPYTAMDDSSMASRMMGLYEERGIDPSLALDSDSEAFREFGLS